MNRFFKHLKKEWPEIIAEVLLPQHLSDLKASGLSEETILEARIYSVSTEEAKTLLNRKKEVGSGYVIPYPTRIGFSKEVNFKPDSPHPDESGKPRKYLRPVGAKQQLYIPRRVWKTLERITIPLIFTEGEKKSLKATQEEFNSIALSGVWNWLANGRPIDDFNYIRLKGRKIYIAFDSDKYAKPQVLKAEKRFAKFLISRGAQVEILDLTEDGVL